MASPKPQTGATRQEEAASAEHLVFSNVPLEPAVPRPVEKKKQKQGLTLRAGFLGLVASMGGFMFGYVR